VLTSHARANSSSPIHRGKLVRERLLCQELPPPPPGVNAQPPPLDPSLTTRERYLAHSQDQACSGCHRLMDPIGFAFEHFDGIGRWRADEGGLPIDSSGEILDSDASDGSFTGVGALGAHLAGSPEVHACFSRQWLRWAYGVDEDAQLGCLADEIEDAFEAKEYVIADLIVALTQTSHFRFRLGPAAEPPPPDEPDAGTPPDPSDGGGGGDPGDTPGVTAEVVKTDQWATGYCAKLVVTNVSAAPVTWRVTVGIEGTINNAWNGQFTQTGDRATFTGAPYNATLAPGAIAEPGFCADL
jgi:cellulase/cellobiase CelA1